jgi:restriction system protein
MTNELKDLSKSKQTAAKTIYEALLVLKEEGGELPGREVMNRIEQRIELSEWEKERYEKTGYIRWQSILHFYSIGCIKAGYLRKLKGIWYLTEEGEDALKLGPFDLLLSVKEKYKKWAAQKEKEKTTEVDEDGVDEEQSQEVQLNLLVEQAIEGIKEYIRAKNPYEFQDLVAALLRAMSYYTPYISPKGRDEGIDIIAYQDPIGTKLPKIKVQVKHRPDSIISVADIRSLKGILNISDDIGLFVTSGQFSSDAKKFARRSSPHIKLIDMEDFISLWQEFYEKLSDEEKNHLPLFSIYFLGSNE